MALKDEIAMIGELDLNKHEAYVTTMIPLLLEEIETYCNNSFDPNNPPGGIKIAIADTIRNRLRSKGLAGRTMGSVSYSYDTNLPDKVLKNLKPYRKLVF